MTHCSEGALLTDLYGLSMLQAYASSGMNDTAVFEFSVRNLPAQRNFLVAAGLEQALDAVTALRFTEDELAWLGTLGQFNPGFLDSLRDLRFSGDIDAIPEGTVVFAGEPLLRIRAPLREAQLLESRLINLLHYPSVVASKAVRSVLAAPGRRLVDFGMRRAHGGDAALLAARASYLAGFDGSATVAAARHFGIPLFGTMAHSFVQAYATEAEAFAAYARAFPGKTTLLIDTYDSEAAARTVVRLVRDQGMAVQAVRIDSGELGPLARRVRNILDHGGCPHVAIFASGNLDEYALQALREREAPIQGYGIGTLLSTAADAPYLDCGYKLVEYAGRPCRKRSPAKLGWPGAKQVYRSYDGRGVMNGDRVALEHEDGPGEPLLLPVMRAGERCMQAPPLASIRAYCAAQLAALPSALRPLAPPSAPYPVAFSAPLQALARQVDGWQRASVLGAGGPPPSAPIRPAGNHPFQGARNSHDNPDR